MLVSAEGQAKPELRHSKSRQSILSNQLMVEDDYESDGEVEEAQLSAIQEETGEGREWAWPSPRRGSVASIVSGTRLAIDICDM